MTEPVWPFTSEPLTSVDAYFTHHPDCWAVNYKGACNCEEIRKRPEDLK